MKNLRYIVILLMVIAGTIHLPAAIVEFGSATQTSWTASAGDECGSGSTVRLNGVVATLGSAADDAVNWTWHAGNAGLLPSQMPSVDGTAGTLITSFSEEAGIYIFTSMKLLQLIICAPSWSETTMPPAEAA